MYRYRIRIVLLVTSTIGVWGHHTNEGGPAAWIVHPYINMMTCATGAPPKLAQTQGPKAHKTLQTTIYFQTKRSQFTNGFLALHSPLRFSFGLLMRKSRSGTPRSSKRCGFNKASSKTRGSGLACSYKPMLYATVKCSHSRMTPNYIEVSTPLWIDRLYVPSQTNTCRS